MHGLHNFSEQAKSFPLNVAVAHHFCISPEIDLRRLLFFKRFYQFTGKFNESHA